MIFNIIASTIAIASLIVAIISLIKSNKAYKLHENNFDFEVFSIVADAGALRISFMNVSSNPMSVLSVYLQNEQGIFYPKMERGKELVLTDVMKSLYFPANSEKDFICCFGGVNPDLPFTINVKTLNKTISKSYKSFFDLPEAGFSWYLLQEDSEDLE